MTTLFNLAFGVRVLSLCATDSSSTEVAVAQPKMFPFGKSFWLCSNDHILTCLSWGEHCATDSPSNQRFSPSERVFGFAVMTTLTLRAKLQALVYDILPSTTAVFRYAIGSRKLSANEQFFVGAQTIVGLLETTQILSAICFMLPCGLRQFK